MTRTTKAPICDTFWADMAVSPRCPECRHINWVHLSEKWDVEAVKCWACGAKFWLDEHSLECRSMDHEEDDSEEDLIEDAWIEDGKPTLP